MKKICKRKNSLKYQSGIALVETIVALGIAIVAITALVSLSVSTLRSSLDSKLLLEGSKIANKQVELVRAYRDGTTWDVFVNAIAGCSDGCHMDSATGNPLLGVGESGAGTEKVSFQFTATDSDGNPINVLVPPDVVRIKVAVTWAIGDETKGAYIYTDLSNWRSE